MGLNAFGRFPRAAILFELVFSVALVFAYHAMEGQRGRRPDRRRKLALYALFVVGVGAWLPTATLPLRGLLFP